MANKLELTARTSRDETPGGAWAFIYLPKKATAFFGTKARVSIKGTINGFPFRSSAFPTGDGTHCIQYNRKMQQGAKSEPGRPVVLVLEVDANPTEEPPAEQAAALRGAAAARRFWKGLSAGYQRLYVDWIASAKKEETRRARAEKAVVLLAQGEKSPR